MNLQQLFDEIVALKKRVLKLEGGRSDVAQPVRVPGKSVTIQKGA